MKKSQLFTLMPALALMSLAGLTACSSSNDAVEGKPDSEKEVVDNQGNVGVRPEFVISFPRSVESLISKLSYILLLLLFYFFDQFLNRIGL